MEENKKVTWRQLKKGDIIKGTEDNNSHTGFKAYVKEINPAYVTVKMWRKGGQEEKIPSYNTFLVPMSEDEFILKYNKSAGMIMEALRKKLSLEEIGYKTQWNAWISTNPWELAQKCKEKKLTILGYSPDVTPKKSWAGDFLDVQDVGICAEDKDGDRFWCHFRSSSIDKMIQMYDRYQEYIREGKIKSANRTI